MTQLLEGRIELRAGQCTPPVASDTNHQVNPHVKYLRVSRERLAVSVLLTICSQHRRLRHYICVGRYTSNIIL